MARQQEEKSAVERLKSRLYARSSVGKEIKEERVGLTPTTDEVPRNWKEEKPEAEAPQEPTQPVAPLPPKAPLSAAVPGTRNATEVISSINNRKPEKNMSFAVKFLIGSFVFFLGALGVSAVLFLL
jgi:hypothetical protein